MNRRGFLASLGAAVGALVLPYEPKRVYSFPAKPQLRGLAAWLPANGEQPPFFGIDREPPITYADTLKRLYSPEVIERAMRGNCSSCREPVRAFVHPREFELIRRVNAELYS